MKIDFSIEDVFKRQNINEAIAYLKTKKNGCGDDGIMLYDLDSFWNLNGDRIVDAIRKNEYEPQIAHERILMMANGKHRKIALMSSVDRLVLRAVSQLMQLAVEQDFSGTSFAYQHEKGVDLAVKKAAEYINSGYEYVIEIDLKDYFEKINHAVLLRQLKQMIADTGVYSLVEKYIVCKIESDYQIIQKNRGLIQGSSLSPVLSNLYLDEFDKWMEGNQFAFIRFADDIRVYLKSMLDGYEVMDRIRKKLEEYSLELNADKSGIYSVYSRKFLGYVFEKTGTSVIVKRYRPEKLHVLSGWHRQAIEKVNQNYYLVNDGILTKKDFTILFQNEEKKFYIPIETADSINIYSDIEINAAFLYLLNFHKLNLNVYDKYGV